MMTRVEERSPATSMTEIVIAPCAAGRPGGWMTTQVSGTPSATARIRTRLMKTSSLGRHPGGTATPGRCQDAHRASHQPARVEGGGDVADALTAVVVERDGHDVEAAADLAQPPPLQILLGEPDEAPPLPPLDRRAGAVVPARPPALHLDEDPDAALAADQVELALPEADVALDDDEAGALEVTRGSLLRRSTVQVAWVGHGRIVRPAPRRRECPIFETAPPGRGRGSGAEVGAADVVVVEEVARRALVDDAPGLHDVGAVRHAERQIRVLLDHEHGRPAPPDVRDDAEGRLDQRRREPQRGLVEEDQPRARHQRARDREHLLLPAGERARRLPPPLGEDREVGRDALEVVLHLAAVTADVGAHLEVFPHGQVREDAAALGAVGDAGPEDRGGGGAVDRRAVEDDAPARRPEQPGDRAQRRRLARAVRADEAG